MDQTKFKHVVKMTISLLDRLGDTVGKGENAGYQHFLLYPQCFPKPSSLGLLRVGIVWSRNWCFPQLYIFSASESGIVWYWAKQLNWLENLCGNQKLCVWVLSKSRMKLRMQL